jgi:hypothetical protein
MMKMTNRHLRKWYGLYGVIAGSGLLLCLLAMMANAQILGTVVQTPTATPEPTTINLIPVPVTLNQGPVPVSFTLPMSIVVAWVITIAALLSGVLVIARFAMKVSHVVVFLTGLEPRIISIEENLEKVKDKVLE